MLNEFKVNNKDIRTGSTDEFMISLFLRKTMNTNSTAIVFLSKYFVDRKQLFRKVIVTRASPQ